jgi:hypothetical protein
MKKYESYSRVLPWLMAILLSALAAGCGGNGDPILGADGLAATPPIVTAVTPVDDVGGVPINNPIISATFSQAMSPITGSASFTVTCAAPCVGPTGTVALDATKKIATFTLPAAMPLLALTYYTATVTGATSLVSGLALASPYVWHFTTTGVAVDRIRPTVMFTAPVTTLPGPTADVPTNTDITAVFSEEMAGASLNSPASSFTLACTTCVTSSPAGTVSYTVGSKSATFKPSAALEVNKTYTATIKGTGVGAATDLASNALAGVAASPTTANDYVWTFSTGAGPAPTGVPLVLSTSPLAAAAGVCPNASVATTFTVPSGLRMDPATINATTFTVTAGLALTPVLTPVIATSIVLDGATGLVATFTPASALTPGVMYTATVKGGTSGVKDLANPANAMASDFSWIFTADSASASCSPAAVDLGAAATFGTFGGSAGMTNMGLLTVINGDIGTTAVSTLVTGYHDAGLGCTYTETTSNAGLVTGLIYTAAPPPKVDCPTEGTATTFAMALAARAAALTAYNALVAAPVAGTPIAANLSGLTVPPGVYVAPGGSFLLQNGTIASAGDLTLDGLGDANAVWVFKMAQTLTVGGPGAAFPRSVNLINGAQAKNVFWQVGSFATINAAGGGTMVGTIIAQEGASFSTDGNVAIVTLNGRALSLGASVTLVNTVINVPAP